MTTTIYRNLVALVMTCVSVAAGAADWGTFHNPFAATSLWNSRPQSPVLGDFTIPTSNFRPLIGEGQYSTGVFLAKPGDKPVLITGLPGSKGLWDPDSEAFHDVVIPRWPADLIPAAGNDGHADIVDPETGMVHSFYKLKMLDGRWFAGQYAWTPLAGRGWGEPGHYFQGARAAAVSTTAGLIRKHEVNDGQPMYRHALAVSLTFNALAAKPSFIFPATSADGSAATTNTGAIPQGALLMLPASFPSQQISHPALRKVVETLKTYGAYVIDRNFGTPFYIYVENGSGFNLYESEWKNSVQNDLEKIRLALRQVVTAEGWIDGDGKPFTPTKNLNMLSMRGPWRLASASGAVLGQFDTWAQAVVFPPTTTRIVQINTSSRNLNPVPWAIPPGGTKARLTSVAKGGAKLQLVLRDRATSAIVADTGELGDGDSATFAWPDQPFTTSVRAISGVGAASSVGGKLLVLAQ